MVTKSRCVLTVSAIAAYSIVMICFYQRHWEHDMLLPDETDDYTKVRVSVVVPVYNSRDFLVPCLKSLFTQTLPGIEYIFVDDNSTDNSAQLIEDYVTSHHITRPVRIIHNPSNIGPGPTRNAGIDVARGEYVGFVDPDDWVNKGFYEGLYKAATANKSRPYDIAKGSLLKPIGKRHIRLRHRPIPVNGRKHRVYEMFYWQHPTGIFRRSLLDKHPDARYGNKTVGEDIYFLFTVGFYAQNITFTNSSKYYYRVKDGSLSRQDKASFYRNFIGSEKAIMEFYFKHIKSNETGNEFLLVRSDRLHKGIKKLEDLYSKTQNKEFLGLVDEHLKLIDKINSYINGTLTYL